MTKNWLFKSGFGLLSAGMSVAPAMASDGEEPLITERPGFSTSPQALPVGRFQLETGIDMSPSGDGWTLPVTLTRFGVAERVEVQFGWGGTALVPHSDDQIADVFVNAKFELASQQGALPNMGFLVGSSIPVDDERSLSDAQPSAAFLWSYDMGQGLGFFGTASAISTSLEDDRNWTTTNAVGISQALSAKIGMFAEVFSSFNDEIGDAHIVDFGVTYLLRRNVQLDLSGGLGVEGSAAYDFVSLGASWRW